MASAGPVAPPLLPAAALRPPRSALEAGTDAEPEEAALAQECGGSSGEGGRAGLARGTPCAKLVSFSCGVEDDSVEGHESPLPVRPWPSAPGLPWVRPRQSLSPYSRKEHVWFNSPMNSAHAITPYAEVYGVHPRFFNFDRSGNKVSSQAEAAAEAAAWEQARPPTPPPAPGAEPLPPDYSPQVNCMASYGRAPAHPAPGQGCGFPGPPGAPGQSFGFPDGALPYGMHSFQPGVANADLNYYGYDYGLLAQHLIAAHQAQQVPAVGLPRPR